VAARKSRHSPERSVEITPDDIEDAADQAETPASVLRDVQITRRSPRVALALALFLVWAAGLATLAVVVTSPVTLNRVQIRRAEVIVQGTPDPTQAGVFLVDRTWPTDATDVVILIDDLDELALEPMQSSLIPLRQTSEGTYAVALTPKPSEARLTYPATDNAVASLEAILNEDDR